MKKVADEKMAGRNPFDISNSDAYVRIRYRDWETTGMGGRK